MYTKDISFKKKLPVQVIFQNSRRNKIFSLFQTFGAHCIFKKNNIFRFIREMFIFS
jgi:hypothetical protein